MKQDPDQPSNLEPVTAGGGRIIVRGEPRKDMDVDLLVQAILAITEQCMAEEANNDLSNDGQLAA